MFALQSTRVSTIFRRAPTQLGTQQRHTQGRPKKYALECDERFEPSISYRCLRGNLSFDASASMRVRRSPSASGESLLNSGWMTVGYSTTIDIWKMSLPSM